MYFIIEKTGREGAAVNEKLVDTIMEIVDEGIICVSAGGVVTHFNRKAKEITGIVLEGGRFHPAGSIQPGTLCSLPTTCWGMMTAA